MIQKINDQVDVALIKQELTHDKLLRKTSNANNELYICTAHTAPNVMQEIGRLREIAFRDSGDGTGGITDIDYYDTMDNPYRQLVIWNPHAEEIVGGCRFFCGGETILDVNKQPILASATLFYYSEQFIETYLPYSLELGRAFVNTNYQTSKAGVKGIFAIDNLWDGIGALICRLPNIKYLFGRVWLSSSLGDHATNLIIYFLEKHYINIRDIIQPIGDFEIKIDDTWARNQLTMEDFNEDYKILNTELRRLGKTIPPLLNAYIKLAKKIRYFGVAADTMSRNVKDVGILVPLDEVYKNKVDRYISSFKSSLLK